jgi:plastocyanin
MRHIYAIGLLIALTGLVGCAASKERPPPPDAIEMTSNSFDPATRTVKQGGTLTFHNPGSGRGALHILVNGDQGAARREQGAASFGGAAGHRSERGDVWTTPVWSTPGTFHITCTIHPEMNLTVTVTPA